jgi:hypothetical protein
MRWEGRLEAALRTMLYPDEPLGSDALALIALGLLLQGGNRLLATDVVIDAIATRRLDPLALAERLAGAVRWPETNISGLAASLQPPPDSGPTAPPRAAAAAGGAAPAPRRAELVDLLRRVALEDDAAVTGAREWLASTTPTSKSGKLARSALEVTGDGTERSIAAAEQARAADAERAA